MIMKRLVLTLAVLAVTATPVLADGDPAKGEKVFAKCKACHMIGEGAKSRVGPVLTGVVGRPIASVEGFKYSDAFTAKKAEGLIWTEENIDTYLTSPKDFVPGNKMTFAGLKKDEDRANVIAYLKQFQ